MEKESNKDIFEAIGQKYGVSAAEVRRDIEQGISEACDNLEPEQQNEFRKQFGDRIPSPEEVIYRLANECKKQINGNNPK